MSGIIWDDMERLKLAIGRWADEEREDQSPPEHVRIAMDHLEDTIAEAWPPEPERGMP